MLHGRRAPGCMLGRFWWGSQDRHALTNGGGGCWCGRSAGGRGGKAAPLTRHMPGSEAGAPRPGRCCTRCGRGLAGAPLGRRPRRWLLDTGSRALRAGKERAEQRLSEAHLWFRATRPPRALLPAAEAGHLPLVWEAGFQRQAAGRRSRSDSRVG